MVAQIENSNYISFLESAYWKVKYKGRNYAQINAQIVAKHQNTFRYIP